MRSLRHERAVLHSRVGWLVWRAVADGRLTRPDACEDCGGADRVQGHHDDYGRLLDVRWLCLPCHKVADRERRERHAAAGLTMVDTVATIHAAFAALEAAEDDAA